MEVNSLELTGFIFGILGVWLTIRENIWCFPIGLVNVIISLFLFYEQKLYSDVVQQIVYVILLTYGWVSWKKKIFSKIIKVSRSSLKLLFTVLLTSLFLTVIMGGFFRYFTDASVPYIDAAATSVSFAAQFLIARKKIENWILWMFVNVTYISVYIYKDLFLYAILFSIYLIMAVVGYIKWKKTLIPEPA